MKAKALLPSNLIILWASLCLLGCSADSQSTQDEKLITTEVLLEEGTNMAVALSPDSTTLALDLQGTIWVMPVSGGKARPITDGMGDCHEPAWSPDGTKLTFHSYKSGYYHIWSIQKDGSQLKQITYGQFDDREPHWSPDGQHIIFSSDRNGNYDIWKVHLGSGKLQALTDDAANEYHPAYAPDGSAVAFVSENKEQAGIYLMDADGSNPALSAASENSLASPSWSPDQQHLIFTAYDGKNSQLVYHTLNSTDTSKVLTADEDIFPFRTAWLSEQEILYTADGKIKKRIIGQEGFSTIPMEATVTLQRYAYDRKTYNFSDTTARPSLGIMGPVISPDGQTVAFTALGDIWLKPLAGEAKPMTNDKFVDINPTWSPDGDKVAYLSDRDGNMDLWVHTLSSGQTEKLVDLEEDLGFPAWSPDGARIAYFARDTRNVWGSGELQIVTVSTEKINALEDTYFVPSKPAWSPDSKTLAIMVLQAASTRYREGLSQIMLITTEGEVLDYVSPEEGRTPAIRNVNGPAWSPDGKHMAYIQDGLLWILPVDEQGMPSGAPEALSQELASAPSWTKNGEKILYLATDTLKLIDIETKEIQPIPLALYWKNEVADAQFVVHAGKLFNGVDSTYQENVDIIVEGNRIKEITAHQESYNIPVIDASDKTIIPGLFEMHTHQHATVGEKLGRIWLSYGITNVREPGADPYDALERKEAWASGKRPGPREFFTGGLTDGSRIYYGLANSVIHGAHMELELERADRLGYDLIKTYVRMPDSIQQIITEAAHEMGIPVSSHEIYPAMRYNVDAVEHIRGTSRRGYSMKQSNLKATYDDVIQLLAKSQMNITPTIGLQGGFYVLAEKNPGIYANRQLNALYPEQYVLGLRSNVQRINKIYPAYLENFEAIQKGVYDIVKAGGKVAAGTDSPFIPYGTSLHVEMQLFVDGGLTPMQALQTATIRAAEAIGVARDLGSIEAGKVADFVIVEGDPLTNIEDAWNVVSTFKGGTRYDIDELLEKPTL
ncbi:Tol biopolymer transport system component/imidazolonepropionase-like amidohydrolase [Catalinimonas alkaloidigena]|uniref:LpqB family beta-propeller domain-containing protein n=1 Tax=Catalinimonas alkaloidigena TaxID=1075417 RepID=UPI0024052719|nr:LpqB family beta-propeller domain-containing protein [Catalinimonas alkaloidigena]MDF9799643.1 Tol biopolymer transport system component/imidazolonepropionase-like amidohydrolase [Catalinimonas alkaloidigena]